MGHGRVRKNVRSACEAACARAISRQAISHSYSMAHALQSAEPPGGRMEKGPMNVRESEQQTPKPDPKALKILAKSIFKQLRTQGYEPQQIISLATEIISLVSEEIAPASDSQR
jgi:hypothetical protein